jgi:small subunit ribosomal protein S3
LPLKKAFVARGIRMFEIDEFLASKLESAGYAGVRLQKTPLGTRIIVQAARPGLVIGKKGKTVKELTNFLEERFEVESPNIEVEEVKDPELNAQIMAERLATGIEKGQHYRRAAYSIMRRVMRRGARGIEVIIGGKITSQRARVQKFREGVVSKCGTPWDDIVSYGVAHTVTKTGKMGVRVLVMPGNVRLPDQFKINDRSMIEAATEAAPQAEEESLFKPQEESGEARKVDTQPTTSPTEPIDDNPEINVNPEEGNLPEKIEESIAPVPEKAEEPEKIEKKEKKGRKKKSE